MDTETQNKIIVLEQSISDIQKQLDALKYSSDIPLDIDNAFNARGFVKENFFIGGFGTIGANGSFRQKILGSDIKSIVLATTMNGVFIEAQLTQGYEENNFGGATSQFDITNPSGDTYRYTWDGTGTDPVINATTLPVGSRLEIYGENFTSNNNLTGVLVTASGANYFEVENTNGGTVENDVTLGATGSITGGKPTTDRELYVEGTALTTFAYIVFLLKENLTTL